MEAFNSELEAFKERITKRAKEKLQKAMEEYEEVGGIHFSELYSHNLG